MGNCNCNCTVWVRLRSCCRGCNYVAILAVSILSQHRTTKGISCICNSACSTTATGMSTSGSTPTVCNFHVPSGTQPELLSLLQHDESTRHLSDVAYLLVAVAQDEQKRAKILAEPHECSVLLQIYTHCIRCVKFTQAESPEAAFHHECGFRVAMSAFETWLARACQTPALRVRTALALLKSQTLECLARMITDDQALLQSAVRQCQQEREQQQRDGLEQEDRRQQSQGQEGRVAPAAAQPSYLSERRLCLYHSLDEAACLVGWIVEVLQGTGGDKASACQCAQCKKGLRTSPTAPPPPQPALCLVSELWRALHDSQLLEAMVRGLLLLQDTLPGQGEQREQGEGDGGASGGVAAAVRAAHADQLQLAEEAWLKFGVRPDRGTLACNLAWMPQGLNIPDESHHEHKRAVDVLSRVSCQLSISAGLVAAVAAAGGGATYGLAPGPLAALAGDVLPLLYGHEEEQGGEAAAAGSSIQLLEALGRRLETLEQLADIPYFLGTPVRIGGITRAGLALVSALVGHATAVGDTAGSLTPAAVQLQQQQQQQQQQGAQEVANAAAGTEDYQQQHQHQETQPHAPPAGQVAAPGSSGSVASTWLDGVPRHVAIHHAARALGRVSCVAKAQYALRDLQPGRPLSWWRRAVELLPLLAVGRQQSQPEKQEGQEEQEGHGTWQPMARHHPDLTATCEDESSNIVLGLDHFAIDDVSRALRAGLLPALERLVREGPAEVAARGEAEQDVAEEVLAAYCVDRSDWEGLMPYADPRQVAGLVSAVADVLRSRVEVLESQGPNQEELFHAARKAVNEAPSRMLAGMTDWGFFDGTHARLMEYLGLSGPLACLCEPKGCPQCLLNKCGGGSGGDGARSGGGGKGAKPDDADTCPARRLAVNLSVFVQQLLPPVAGQVLWAEQQGDRDAAVAGASAIAETLMVLCLRVQSDDYRQQQQQQGRATRVGGAGAKGGRAAGKGKPSSSGGDTTTAVAVAGPAAAKAWLSWRELLLSLQPFTLLRLALQGAVRDHLDPPVCALWALALALPEDFAAALQHDPELTACIARRVEGWEGSKPDHSLHIVLQEVVPLLPPCKAVTALEGRCALPVVSRAKREKARERVVRMRGVQARVHVLVDMEEVWGVLEGVGA